LACLCILSLSAVAAEPVALVEDVTGSSAGVDAMTYVAPGTVIKLGAKDKLVLDYLRSCVRESVAGGTVTVGTETSRITGGTVGRETVPCDGGQLTLSNGEAAESGVVVFRMPPGKKVRVERRLYGLCPLIDLPGGGRLVVERLDHAGEKIEIDVAPAQLVHGSFYDFATAGRSLAAGGLYRASAGGRHVVFTIDPQAQPGQAPLAGRLLKL
jgi:hypothetical protein